MLKKNPFSIFHRTIATLLVMILLLSDFPVAVYANETGTSETGTSETGTSVDETICGLEEHVHTEECYGAQETLICGRTVGEGATLQCGLEESESHTHDAACYAQDGHVHSEACYQTNNILVCEKEEHQHTEQCSSAPTSEPETETEPVMSLPETETEPVMSLEEGGANSTGAEIVITDYNQDFIAYNYYCYRNNTGAEVIGGNGYSISGSSSNRSVRIGDQTGEGLSENQQPKTENIQVELNNLALSGDAVFQVLPVYHGQYQVIATAVGVTSLNQLTMESNSNMTLTVNADTVISNLTLAAGSKLSITVAAGVTLSLGNVTGSGALILSGTGTVAVSDSITVGSLEVSGVTVSGSPSGTAVVSATETLTLHSGMVQNLALFGYADSASGSRTLKLEGGNFNDVAAIGVSAGNTGVILRIEGLNLVGLTNTNVYRDYALSYEYNGSAIGDTGWPQNYRVQYVNSSASTVGSRTLPVYSLPGYVFTGWLIGERAEPVRELPESGIDGDLVLSAQMQAGEVGVTFDLGFEPSDLTNDRDAEGVLPTKTTFQASSVGADLNLTVPQRFGYVFQGWKITTGEARQISKEAASTKISYSDLTDDNGTYTLILEAQWELDTFPIKLQPTIGFSSDINHLEISVDGGTTWETLSALAARTPNMFWDADATICTFVPEIEYGETLGSFFKRVFGAESSYPILQDTRTVEDGKTRFLWWKTAYGTTLQADSNYEYGNGGFLDTKAQNQLLQDYQTALKDSPVVLGSEWSATLQYFLTTDTPAGWSILVGDKNASPAVPDENGRITVGADSTVYYRVARSSADRISSWMFTMNQGTNPIYPAMESVASGDQHLYYTFIMPNSDVTAAYMSGSGAQPVYVDIAQSPITFAENISYQGLTGLTGFWYSKRMVRREDNGMVVNAMTPLFYTTDIGNPSAYTPVTGSEASGGWYFYEYDSANRNFYVTSCNEETQNQLTLVNATKGVYLRKCRLMATSAYSQGARGVTIDGFTFCSTGYTSATINQHFGPAGLSKYGNIVMDVETHTAYTTNIWIDGENTVAVFTKSSSIDGAVGLGKINITGINNGTLNVAKYMSRDTAVFSNLILNEYNSIDYPNRSEYLIQDILTYGTAATNSNSFNYCKINWPNSTINNAQFSANISFYNSTVLVNVLYSANVSTSGSTYLRTTGDMRVYYSLQMSGSSSVVVDGVVYNAYTTGNSWGNNINTTGFLVVKGSYLDSGMLTLKKGTILCNTLLFDNRLNFTGGTIIANQISNDLRRITSNQEVNQNGDDYPYLTYAGFQGGNTYKSTFGGGNVYLFGGYQRTQSGGYDTTYNLQSPGNPLSEILDSIMDENGDVDSISFTDQELRAAVDTKGISGNECTVFGNSTFDDPDNKYYSVVFSGTKLYAAGNVTLYNDTSVTGGEIYCGGKFSSKRDLTISGGSISAKEVGNSYHLTEANGVGNPRWEITKITNGATVVADRVGAVSTAHGNAGEVRSTLTIAESASISASTAESPVWFVSDLKVNYINDDYTNSNTTENLHYSGTSIEMLTMVADVVFAPPVHGTENGVWLLDSLGGSEITKAGGDGFLYNGSVKISEEKGYVGRDTMTLYAAKTNYTLELKSGSEYLVSSAYTQNGVTYPIQFTGDPASANISKGSQVVLSLNSTAMKDKVLVYYTDANGVPHNIPSERNVSGTNVHVTFTMPATDTVVEITDSFTLFLDKYGITFTEGGFLTEFLAPGEQPVRDDSAFVYSGDITVTQTNITATTIVEPTSQKRQVVYDQNGTTNSNTGNRLRFMGNWDSRKIVVTKTIQSVVSSDYTNFIDAGVTVCLVIDGPVCLASTYLPETSVLKLQGANGKETDILNFSSNSITFSVGTYVSGEKSGSFYLENITLYRTHGTVIASYSATSATVEFKNARVKEVNPYYYATIKGGFSEVILDNTEVTKGGSSAGETTAHMFVMGCSKLTIKNGSTMQSSYAALMLHGANSVEIENSVVWLSVPTNGIQYEYYQQIPSTMRITGNSKVTLHGYQYFKSLSVENTAELSIFGGNYGETANTGYLVGENITVKDQAKLNAGYLLVSGFWTYGNSSRETNNRLVLDNNVNSGVTTTNPAANGGLLNGSAFSGLHIEGGTVNATEFVGGDINGKVTVSGGVLNTKRLGVYGAVFGKLTTSPSVGESFMISYPVIPSSDRKTVITITGGTVNVAENGYLGGMNATVNQSGGTVNLADGAVLGMTEGQKTALADSYSAAGDSIANHTETNINVTVTGGSVTAAGTGKISTPYGKISISEADGSDTQVSVRNCTAESGTITIKNACDGLTNPYPTGDTVSLQVGILISDTLSARVLRILDGAAVYADRAYSDVKADENGVLEISQDAVGSAAHTALYPGSFFGMMGSGEVAYRTVNTYPTGGYQQNVYGTKRVRIRYELCDDAIDPATNSQTNPEGFTVGSFSENNYLFQLQEPSRFGFEFEGWYEQADYSGTAVTQILTTNSGDIVLYAKWTPRLIPFTVSVSTDKVADLVSANETAGLAGSFNGDSTVFTFTASVEVPYRSVLIGTASTPNQVHLVDYQLATYSITEMVWKNGGTQTLISAGSTVVSRGMVEAYDASEAGGHRQPLTLFVNATAKRRLLLTLDINLKSGLPKDARFNNSASPDNSTSTTISSYADFGKTYGDAAGFAASDGKLIQPTAPGYTFQGWNTKADGTGEFMTANLRVTSSSPLRLYAIWEANSYQLVFDAGDGNIVTKGSADPTASDDQRTLSGEVVYDQVINGNIRYDGEGSGAEFPYAWKKGYVFLGWRYGDTGDTVNLTSGMKLNLTDISCLNLDGETALTLHAVYRKIRVTYDPNGGTWLDSSYGTGKETVTVNAPDYGEALAGYVKDAAASGSDSVLTGTVGNYSVITTTIDGYNRLHNYVENDYRGTILRKGYTFFGWYTTQAAAQAASSQDTGDDFFPSTYSEAVGTVPEYRDITLYASWKANAYTLTLHAGTSSYSTMVQDNVSTGREIPLKVADEVKGTYITEGDILWPKRSDWYAHTAGNSDENAKRYLLGFTFDSLDPGDSKEGSAGYDTYKTYASSVTQLIRKNAIFYKAEGTTSGTIFQLPEDANYGSTIITGTNRVPDYPTGYTIPLYAVYRERSLVFIEYVVDASGAPSRTVLGSYPYNEFVNFPAEYLTTESYQNLTARGYKLLKWGVNGFGIEAIEYPSDATTYNANKESYKSTATSMGTFDINVYTVYAAQVTDTYLKPLTANGDPTASNVSTYTYKLPMSMQNGVIKYRLLDNNGNAYDGFELVTREQMNAHRYSPDYSGKIALTMQIVNANGDTVGSEVDLQSSNDLILLSESSIGAGYSIRLRMYYSSVMTEENVKTFSLKCSFFRDSTPNGQNMEQFFLLKNIQTKLTPSRYTVVYDANLPEDLYRVVTDWKDFETTGKRTVETAYGSNLLDAAPVIEGYTSTGKWTRTKADGTAYQASGNEVSYGAPLTLPVSAADHGRIYLQGAYQANTYQLKLSTEVFDKWTVKIDGQEITENILNRITGGKTVDVNYHQTITFTGKTLEEPAEFIRLSRIDDSRSLGELDLFATPGTGNTYTFRMPNYSVEASYQNVRTLYLEDGTISLVNNATENGYRQADQPPRTWRGSYQIWMDRGNNTDNSSTSNRLVIDGDFSGRDISLGKLNINANDSIELKSGATVTLKSSDIQAKNIAVPSGASLTMNAASDTSDIKLTPDVGYAAIGGHNGANGAINLEKLKISMTLPAGSSASGIGAGSQEASLSGCGDVLLKQCNVVVDEKSSASSAYQGSWIGGAAVPNVTIQNTHLDQKQDNASMSGPYVLNGKNVRILESGIGGENAKVNDPIYASTSLTISNSNIYQRIQIPLGNVAVFGTGDGGTVTVTTSNMMAEFAGAGSSNKLYSGTLKLTDAASQVVVHGIQIMDVNNGTITISESGTNQSSANHSHTGSYLLLNEFDSYSGANDLVVNGLTGNAQVQTNTMMLQQLTVNCDTPLKLNGNLTVTDTTTIAAGKTLDVAANTNIVTMESFGGSLGNYRQSGGKLTSGNDLIVGGNLTLEDVTATLGDKKLGSNGAAGVTTVAIQDSTVTAAEIGALGTQNTTFTFVELSGSNAITGNLIQDHYRIAYDLNETNYSVDNLPTVLRSSTVCNTTLGASVYQPEIPASPNYTGTGTASFKNWYVTKSNGDNVVLSNTEVAGFAQYDTLDASYLEHAVDTDPSDRTKTLVLHAWMSLNGKAVIQTGANFADMGAITGTDTSVIDNGQWTARFEIQGTVIAGSKYQFAFGSPIPKGTKLTLCDRSTGTLAWYYYIAQEAVSSVSSDAFVRMGSTTEKAVLPAGNEGDPLADKLQLIADFSAAESPATDNTVSMKLQVGGQLLDITDTSLSYTAVAAATASITATGSDAAGTITVTVYPGSDGRLDGKKLYAVAVIHDAVTGNAISVPYDATAACNETSGMWLGGNTVAFTLGDYGALSSSFSWSITGLQAGSYKVQWYLTAAKDATQNPFDRILAEAEPVSFTQAASIAPSMTAVLTQVDGMAVSGQVLTAGNAHTVCFTVETNQTSVEYWVEEQTALKNFAKLDATDGSAVNGSTVSITIPAGEGTYRVRFSIKAESDWDDVYYTFIVR